MKWFVAIVVGCVWVTTAAVELVCEPSSPHSCVCKAESTYMTKCTVDGHEIEIINVDDETFSLNCKGWQALDSPAMPHYKSEFLVNTVELDSCPLPASSSLANALGALKVSLRPLEDKDKGKSKLVLENLPSEPQLTARHFIGFKRLTDLKIEGSPLQQVTVEFLAGLPRTIRDLTLKKMTVPPLTKTLNAVPYLNVLLLKNNNIGTVSSHTQDLRSNKTKVKNEISSLETLWLIRWKEQNLVPMVHCDSLRNMQLLEPNAETLPDRWVAACPQLEVLSIESASKLSSLPPRLLEGAISLTHFIAADGVLQSLPDRFFKDCPKLIEIHLSHNKLQTFESHTFLGPGHLQLLSLEYNLLKTTALEAVAPLISLQELNLHNNPTLDVHCYQQGNSILFNLVQLKMLSMYNVNIYHICRDWRENMKFLEILRLDNSHITQLQFADFQYTRDASVKHAVVFLDDSPISSISFTEEEYKKALTAPATNAMVHLGMEELKTKPKCDCSMYWTRLTMANASQTLSIDNIYCSNGRVLKDMTLGELCPERASA